MNRYCLTELTPSGYGRRVYTDLLRDAEAVMSALGGRWRVQRQWHADGRWRRDGGRSVWETAGPPRHMDAAMLRHAIDDALSAMDDEWTTDELAGDIIARLTGRAEP